jgi:pimeloyl-ACP methyl ester carboxylesterase
VPDLRGHGESSEPGEKGDLEAHLQDVIDTLADVEVRSPAIFAGHSLGAIIAMELAQRRADLVGKVLAVAMPGRVPMLTKKAFEWFLGWPYHSIRGAKLHRYLDWRSRELISTNHHTLGQIAVHFGELDYVQNLINVTCPVHFAVGRFDPVAPCKYVEQMHKALPNSTLQIIEWAGHNCMDSQPGAFNRWFLEKVKGK